MAEKHDKADIKADKKMIASAVHKHEKRMHPGKAPTDRKSTRLNSSHT